MQPLCGVAHYLKDATFHDGVSEWNSRDERIFVEQDGADRWRFGERNEDLGGCVNLVVS